jgi:hypothetical protein
MPKPSSRNKDSAYANYVRICRRIGVRPQPPELAKAQIETWIAALAARQERPTAQIGAGAAIRTLDLRR